ncbi:MAG: hypothetical protein JOY92_07185 [Verrucomicrobia bacterium]|nr:hypothetical protein [Verrucomicrobiota bacterium]
MNTLKFAALGDVRKPGFSVPEAAGRLVRFAYLEKRLMFFCAAHMVGVCDRDLKVYLGRLQYQAASRADALRGRLRELRTPKIKIDGVPDPALEILADEAMHAGNDLEVATILHWLHAGLEGAYRGYRGTTNPLADAPTCDLLDSFASSLRPAVERLEACLAEVGPQAPGSSAADLLGPYLSAAGGWGGAHPRSELPPRQRSIEPFRIRRQPGRDGSCPRVWDYVKPAMEEVEAHLTYMMGIRFSEINVAEGLSLVLCETPGMPWEFYFDVSRHLWDEVRHSLMGEAAIESTFGSRDAIPMRDYESVYCMEATPLEQYATLGLEIEGGQMKYPVGKRGEWEFCRDAARHALMTTFQDYDWADEVLHVNLAKRRLSEWFPDGAEQLSGLAAQGKARRSEVKARQQPVVLARVVSPALLHDPGMDGGSTLRPVSRT